MGGALPMGLRGGCAPQGAGGACPREQSRDQEGRSGADVLPMCRIMAHSTPQISAIYRSAAGEAAPLFSDISRAPLKLRPRAQALPNPQAAPPSPKVAKVASIAPPKVAKVADAPNAPNGGQ